MRAVREHKYISEVLLLFVAGVWGINFVIVKAALSDFLPGTFNSIRFIVASMALLGGLLLLGRQPRLARGELLPLLGAGALQTTFYQILFIEGIARTSASNSAVILAATPAVVAAVGAIFKIERLRLAAWTGIILAFVGLYLVVQGGAGDAAIGPSTLAGDLLTVGAMLLWAGYTVLAKPLLQQFGALRLTALSTAFGTVPLLLWYAPAFGQQDWESIRLAAWGEVFASGLFAIGVAYIIWNFSVGRVGPARTAIFSNLIPVIAVGAAFFLLGEQISAGQILGAACVLVGILLTRK